MLKSIINKLAILFLIVFVFALLPLTVLSNIIKDRNEVKSILSDADVYNNLTDNILDIITTRSENGTLTVKQALDGNDYISSEKAFSTVKNAIGDDTLQVQSEKLIDGVYDYLDGGSDNLEFNFSLKERANIARKEIKSFASESFANLPDCPADRKYNFNIIVGACVPVGSNIESEINSYLDFELSESGVFGGEFTEKDLDISSSNLELAKEIYGALKYLNLMFFAFLIGTGAVIVVTAKTKHSGLKVLGRILITKSVVLIILSLITYFGSNTIDDALQSGVTQQQDKALLNVVGPAMENILSKVAIQTVLYSAVFGSVGLLLNYTGRRIESSHSERRQESQQSSNAFLEDTLASSGSSANLNQEDPWKK